MNDKTDNADNAHNADRARDLLAARREHSKGQGNFPTPEPHFGMRDERPEDREPRDLPKERDDRSAPKGDVPAGQDDRNPELETRVPRTPAPRVSPPGGMEPAEREVERPQARRGAGPRRETPRPMARRSSAAKREATRGERPTGRGRPAPGRAAKDTEKKAKRRVVEVRASKRPAPIPRRATAPIRRSAGLVAAPRRMAKAAAPSRTAGGRSGNVRRTAARARGSAKPLTKGAAKGAGPNKTQGTAQGGKQGSRRTSAGRGRTGRR